jgi:uncharacterized protein
VPLRDWLDWDILKKMQRLLLPAAAVLLLAVGCGAPKVAQTRMMNPVGYFEIPAKDLDRAVRFYSAVFGYDFTRQSIDGNEMALFPLHPDGSGISGALAKGETYVPSLNGSLVYFDVADIDAVIAKANANGGKPLYPKTSIGDLGFVAEIQDSEANRIGLHSKR